jgi:MoaA/NifB/PqqE/SkfB family radical SAM enzyme
MMFTKKPEKELEPTVRTYRLYSNPLLKASAAIDGGKVSVRLGGPLSVLPGVRSAVSLIDGQIPVRADERLFLSTWLPPIPSIAFDRLAMSQLKGQMGMRTPDQVTISITEECPNRCLHCALPNSGRKLRLSPETVKDIIGQILNLGTTLVIFDGGEPALYHELPELVRFVDSRAISTMFTSGAGFTASLARQLKDAGLHAVNISLDSPVHEEHDAMRGRQGVFRDAMNAAGAALQAGLLVDFYVVLRRENIRHLQAFHDLALERGAHELTFFEVTSSGRWSEKDRISLTKDDHMSLEGFVASAGHRQPRIFSVPDAYKRFGCFAARSWMHVTPEGDVYPCACLPEPCGNIHQEPIKEIWRRMGRLPYAGRKTCPVRR